MVGPEGRDSPSPIGPLLIWQQPHPIYYAELCRRIRGNSATLKRYAPIVFESAAFMASYAYRDTNIRPPDIPTYETCGSVGRLHFGKDFQVSSTEIAEEQRRNPCPGGRRRPRAGLGYLCGLRGLCGSFVLFSRLQLAQNSFQDLCRWVNIGYHCRPLRFPMILREREWPLNQAPTGKPPTAI